IKGLAHITGGGLLENIPRILPAGTAVQLDSASWPVLPVFSLLQRIGRVTDREMYRTFNMGIGMVLIVDPAPECQVSAHLSSGGESLYQIGRITQGDRTVAILRQGDEPVIL